MNNINETRILYMKNQCGNHKPMALPKYEVTRDNKDHQHEHAAKSLYDV